MAQGGLEFFTTQIEAAEGDIVLLQCAMDAANKEVDPVSAMHIWSISFV